MSIHNERLSRIDRAYREAGNGFRSRGTRQIGRLIQQARDDARVAGELPPPGGR